jgi:hypothetical protein
MSFLAAWTLIAHRKANCHKCQWQLKEMKRQKTNKKNVFVFQKKKNMKFSILWFSDFRHTTPTNASYILWYWYAYQLWTRHAVKGSPTFAKSACRHHSNFPVTMIWSICHGSQPTLCWIYDDRHRWCPWCFRLQKLALLSIRQKTIELWWVFCVLTLQ